MIEENDKIAIGLSGGKDSVTLLYALANLRKFYPKNFSLYAIYLDSGFYDVGFTTKENNDMSHGYGLSIVKELVEKNNGKITVKSTEEKTSFKICFNMI